VLGLLVLFVVAYGLLILSGVVGVLWQMNRPRRKTLGVSLALGGPGDPADLGLVGQEVVFNLSDGSASPGWIIQGDAAGEGSPVAVVVHGHRDSRFGSLYRAEMLRRYVSAVVVFDLPGHGDAEAKRCLMGAREAEDVKAVVRGLPPEVVAGRPVVLLGYSMGATIAIKAAKQRSMAAVLRGAGGAGDIAESTESVESAEFTEFAALKIPGSGVIACAPYRLWDEGLRGQLRRRGLPAWPMVGLVGLTMRVAWTVSRAFSGRGPGLLPGSRLFPGLGERPGFDRAVDAAAMGCPLLVLHGDADQVCPLDAGRRIAEAATDGELVVIPGGTHNQLLGADYDAVHAALAAFFKKLGQNREMGIMERSPDSADGTPQETSL